MANKKEGEKSLREKQVEERRERMKELNPPVERVRVTPANDDMRRVLKHPKGGLKFPESGSVEWPLDQFTRRRIKDGSVKREDKKRDDARRQPQPGYQQPPQPQASPQPNPPNPPTPPAS